MSSVESDLPKEIEHEIEMHVLKLMNLTFNNNTTQWVSLWNKQDIFASKYYENGLTYVRGETLLPYTINEIFQLLSRSDCRRDMDTLIAQTQRLKWYSPHTGVERLVYKPVWPTDPRDFSNITHWRLLEDGTLVLLAFSYPLKDICPEQPPFVRGRLHLGGYALKHVPGGTKLYLVVQCDLAGRIPKPIAEYVAKTQPLALLALKKMLLNRYINSIRPNFANPTKPSYEELIEIARTNQQLTQPVVKDLNTDEITEISPITKYLNDNSNEKIVVAPDEDGYIMRGVLYKERETLKGWRQRYFTLDEDFLHYFLDASDQSPRNSFQIDASVLVTLDASSFPLVDSSGNSLYVFILRHPISSRAFRLASRSIAEATSWVNCIQSIIDKHKLSLNESVDADKADPSSDIPEYLTNLNSSQRNALEKTIKALLNTTIDSKHQWSQLFNNNGIIGSRAYDPDGGFITRGESVLPYSITEIFGVLSRSVNRKPLDPMIEAYERKKWFNLHTGIEYVQYYAKWPTSSRDFCNLTHWRLLSNNTFIMAGLSVEDSSCPLRTNENIVRGILYYGGYVMQQLPEGGTKVYIIVKSNLGGSIPKAIVEFASAKQPMALLSVHNFLNQKYLTLKREKRIEDHNELLQQLYSIANENVGGISFVQSSNVSENTSVEVDDDNINESSTKNDQNPSQSSTMKDFQFLFLVPFLFLLLQISPLLVLIFFIIEIYLGRYVRRIIPKDVHHQYGHSTFQIDVLIQDLKKKNTSMDTTNSLKITTTDILVKIFSTSLAMSPQLHGYILGGIFFPSQPNTPLTIKIQRWNSLLCLQNSHQMSVDDIHGSLHTSSPPTPNKSLPLISFLLEFIKFYLIKLWFSFSYGYALIMSYPVDDEFLGNYKYSMNCNQIISNSSFPIIITCPEMTIPTSQDESPANCLKTTLPITITMNSAIPHHDAVKFIKIFQQQLLSKVKE